MATNLSPLVPLTAYQTCRVCFPRAGASVGAVSTGFSSVLVSVLASVCWAGAAVGSALFTVLAYWLTHPGRSSSAMRRNAMTFFMGFIVSPFIVSLGFHASQGDGTDQLLFAEDEDDEHRQDGHEGGGHHDLILGGGFLHQVL